MKNRPNGLKYKSASCYTVYDMDDNIVRFFESSHEAAEWFGMNYNTFHSALSKHIKGEHKSITKDGKHYKVFRFNNKELDNV